jgi:2-dehydro-3-deoxyphosphogluconate aldolase/(4S)-4-hydroxy-2-oxoglutarate aldolase
MAWCRSHDVLVLPGVMTPTEMMRAVGAGLDVVKLFPASLAGGVRALEAVRPVFPSLRFVPTGGIVADDLADYLRLDNVVACGGSWMVGHDLVAGGDVDRIRRLADDAVKAVRRARSRGDARGAR